VTARDEVPVRPGVAGRDRAGVYGASMDATTTSPTTGEVTLRPGPEALQRVGMRFLRQFGLVCAAWTALLAVTAPSVERPWVLWAAVGVTAGWAAASFVVPPSLVWGAGWLVVATMLELTGPAAGTQGWSVVGGATFLVIAAAALSGRRRLVVGVVLVLSIAALARPLLSPGWNVGGGISTLLIFALGATALTWLTRLVTGTVAERDRLATRLARAEREAAVAAERAEAAARLHDSVLQTLTQLERAAGDPASASLAATASADLRAFLRQGPGSGRLWALLDRSVMEAAGADRHRVRFTHAGADPEVDARLSRLADAAAEAVRNAVTHTDGPVRVMGEVDAEQITVWVADRGAGFDPEDLPDDRLGVRESIVGRLRRAGGSAELGRTSTGAEWRLRLPRGE
jgi:signal transduction histidine kinase